MPCYIAKNFLISKVLLSTRMHSSRMQWPSRLGVGRVSAWGGGVCLRGRHLPMDRMTDARENITLRTVTMATYDEIRSIYE